MAAQGSSPLGRFAVARMICKFCAAMKLHIAIALLLAVAPLALAEKADRGKPLTIEADQPGTLDLVKQVVVFNGNVVVAQGTMAIRAERVEVRERADGHRSATAVGNGGKPASFKQKRDTVDEWIEGVAERIEYDSRGDVVRFVGNAQVRRLRGGAPADEITGALITYDSGNETFSVQGAPAPVAGAASGTGNSRIKVTLAPRPDKPEAPASAASR
jgi:lipopolysaccharide export system protein LptA